MEGGAMSITVINQFKKLCQKAKIIWDKNTFGVSELEPYLLDILFIVKNNIDCRKDFSDEFVKILTNYRYGPLEIVIFCMRELQWKEVKEAALNIQLEAEDPRVKISMQDVLNVYQTVWEDADLYEYYSKEGG